MNKSKGLLYFPVFTTLSCLNITKNCSNIAQGWRVPYPITSK